MEAGALPSTSPGRQILAARLALIGTDQRLVRLLRDGHETAFEALYDRHHRAILGFCRQLLGDAHEAEDATQHTFLAAYRELTGSSREIDLRPWLFTVARNRCISMLRARRDQPVESLDPSPSDGPTEEFQRREDLRVVLADVARLPPQQRAALVMSELHALSHAEIGDVLGLGAARVKALVFGARTNLAASRAARDTPCAEIRQTLTEGRGAVLRRANLRHHLRQCDGCRDFRRQLERERRELGLVLPAASPLALKQLLGALAILGGSGAAVAGGRLMLGGLLRGSVIKAVLGGVLASGLGGAVAGTTPLPALSQPVPVLRFAPLSRAVPPSGAQQFAATAHRALHRAAPEPARVGRTSPRPAAPARRPPVAPHGRLIASSSPTHPVAPRLVIPPAATPTPAHPRPELGRPVRRLARMITATAGSAPAAPSTPPSPALPQTLLTAATTVTSTTTAAADTAASLGYGASAGTTSTAAAILSSAA